MLQLVGSPRRFETSITSDGDWTADSEETHGLNSEGAKYDKRISLDDELEANRPAGAKPAAPTKQAPKAVQPAGEQTHHKMSDSVKIL